MNKILAMGKRKARDFLQLDAELLSSLLSTGDDGREGEEGDGGDGNSSSSNSNSAAMVEIKPALVVGVNEG